MQRMRIVGPVAEHEPIARPLLQHELLVVRIILAVHRKAVEQVHPARDLFKRRLDLR